MKNYKKLISFILILVANFAFACDACKLQQPKITQSFTHGTGPESSWDWMIVGVIAIITLYTLFYSLKYLIKPGEKNRDHIKNSILN